MVMAESPKEFIDLGMLTKLLNKDNPEDFWFYKDCIVDTDGIYARPIANGNQTVLIGEERRTLEEFVKDIKLDFPCTYDEFALWARRNQFSYILDGIISCKTLEIQGMKEFNEKYEAIYGHSFWNEKSQSDDQILEINIDNQTLIDNPIQKLIKENNLSSRSEWNYFFILFCWKGQLAKEKENINPRDYSNKKDYDDRLRALNGKINEIDSFNTDIEERKLITEDEPPVMDKTITEKQSTTLDDKHRKINYQAWALYENLDAFTAASLWCEQNPYCLEVWDEIEYIEVRNLVIHMFKHQLEAENYPQDKTKVVIMELSKKLDVGMSECLEQCRKIILSREQLKTIAIKMGVRPKFLFSEVMLGNTIPKEQPDNLPEEQSFKSFDKNESHYELKAERPNQPDEAGFKSEASNEHIKGFIKSISESYPKATSKDIVGHCFDCYKGNNRKLTEVKAIIEELGIKMDKKGGKRTSKAIEYMQEAPKYKPTQ